MGNIQKPYILVILILFIFIPLTIFLFKYLKHQKQEIIKLQEIKQKHQKILDHLGVFTDHCYSDFIIPYQVLLNKIPQMIYVHSKEQFEFMNQAGLDFVGLDTLNDLKEVSIVNCVHPVDCEKIVLDISSYFQKNIDTIGVEEYHFVRKNGSVMIGEVQTILIEYHGKAAVLGVVTDITDKKAFQEILIETNEHLLVLSRFDGLTGIPNRRSFDQQLRTEWRRAYRNKHWISLLMIDLDHFKRINDTCGHLQGDKSLIKVAKKIDSLLCRPADFTARYGGEEFAVILPETDGHGAIKVANRIRLEIEKSNLGSRNLNNFITVSIGVASLIPEEDSRQEILLDQADLSLYDAKGNGRNRVGGLSLNTYEGC